jgi:thiol-disulfide isomerase/thioredoxin
MKQLLPLSLAATLVAASSFQVPAADLGDPAAGLQISDWVKGQPVKLADGKGKTVYVVEFWATWCPPCRTSIPHLTEMQKKFKDRGVVFVGVSDEKLSTVQKFVEKMGDKMDYTVAVDQDRQTSDGYMKAYGINGIPHAFIVDKEGRVVWNGHPMAGLDAALERVLSGKLDLDREKKRAGAQTKLEALYQLAAKGGNDAEIEKQGKELEALDKELDGITPGEKFDLAEMLKQIKFRTALTEFQQAALAGADAAELEKLQKAAQAVAPKDVPFDGLVQQVRFQAALRRYQQAEQAGQPAAEVAKLAAELKLVAPKDFDLDEMIAGRKATAVFGDYLKAVSADGDAAKAAELAKQLGELKFKNPAMLNEFAWAILTEDSVKQRDVALATKLAKTAFDASGGQDAGITDTYARALFDSGKVADAIAIQRKAVAAAKEDELKSELTATLKKYEAAGAGKK